MSLDMHRKTAATLFRVPEDLVTDRQRRAGKAYNFAKQYRASDSTALHIALKFYDGVDRVLLKGV